MRLDRPGVLPRLIRRVAGAVRMLAPHAIGGGFSPRENIEPGPSNGGRNIDCG